MFKCLNRNRLNMIFSILTITSNHDQFSSGNEAVGIISEIVNYVLTEPGFNFIKTVTVITENTQSVFFE